MPELLFDDPGFLKEMRGSVLISVHLKPFQSLLPVYNLIPSPQGQLRSYNSYRADAADWQAQFPTAVGKMSRSLPVPMEDRIPLHLF